MLKLSFTTMGTPRLNGFEAIAAAAKYGFQGVDLRVSDHLGQLTVASTPSEIQALREAFHSHNVHPVSLLCYNAKASEADPASWQAMKTSLLRHLEIAARLGTDFIRIFVTGPQACDNPVDFMKRTADTLSQTLEADRSQVAVLIQNHRNGIKALDCAALIEQVNHPRLGLCFSPDHCIMESEDLPAVLAAVKEITRQFYVADVKQTAGKEGDAYLPVLPGRGLVPLKKAYDALGGSRFHGWVTFKWEKIWHEELEEADVALPYFMNFVQSWM